MNKLKKNKNFYLLVDKIINKSSSQKIKILKFINSADSIYYKRAEAFSKEFIRYLKNEKINIDFAI